MGTLRGGRYLFRFSRPVVSRHPISRELIVTDSNQTGVHHGKRQPQGRIPPGHRPSTTGTASEIRWVREATCIKRIRRKLALHGQALIKTREGTDARRENGVYAIADKANGIFAKSVKLDSLARGLGVLAEDERIDPPMRGGCRPG